MKNIAIAPLWCRAKVITLGYENFYFVHIFVKLSNYTTTFSQMFNLFPFCHITTVEILHSVKT